ncbi:hypothetical protein [Streptomyces sp. NPDC054834]
MVAGEAQALAQAGNQQQPARPGGVVVLFAKGGEGALHSLLPVALTPAVIGGVVGVAYGGTDQAVEVEGPQAERVLANEGALGQPQGGARAGRFS